MNSLLNTRCRQHRISPLFVSREKTLYKNAGQVGFEACYCYVYSSRLYKDITRVTAKEKSFLWTEELDNHLFKVECMWALVNLILNIIKGRLQFSL